MATGPSHPPSSPPIPSPDLLAAFIYNLAESGKHDRHHKLFSRRADRDASARSAQLLDSLAVLAVRDGGGQVVATGATIDDEGGLELYVAENGKVNPKVIERLERIASVIHEALQLRAKASVPLPIVDRPSSSPKLSALIGVKTDEAGQMLRALEREQVDYNRVRIEKRYRKRIERFKLLMADIHREAARSDATDVRSHLSVADMSSDSTIVPSHPSAADFPSDSTIPSSDAASADLGNPTAAASLSLLLAHKDIALLDKLSALLDSLGKSFELTNSEERVLGIRGYSLLLYDLLRAPLADWENDNPLSLFALCETYFFQSSNAGQLPLGKWLRKLVSLPTHFRRLIDLVGSTTLAPLLTRKIKVHAVKPQLHDLDIELTYGTMRDIAAFVGWRPDLHGSSDKPSTASQSEVVTVPSFQDQVFINYAQDLEKRLPLTKSSGKDKAKAASPAHIRGSASIGNLNRADEKPTTSTALSPAAPEGAKLTTEALAASTAPSPFSTVIRHYQQRAVHCECGMALLYFQTQGKKWIPAWGISKLCCVFCKEFLAVFMEQTGFRIDIKGCHGQFGGPWVRPRFADSDFDNHIEDRLREVLRPRVHAALFAFGENERLQVARGHVKKESQSTAGSNDAEPVTMDEIQLTRSELEGLFQS